MTQACTGPFYPPTLRRAKSQGHKITHTHTHTRVPLNSQHAHHNNCVSHTLPPTTDSTRREGVRSQTGVKTEWEPNSSAVFTQIRVLWCLHSPYWGFTTLHDSCKASIRRKDRERPNSAAAAAPAHKATAIVQLNHSGTRFMCTVLSLTRTFAGFIPSRAWSIFGALIKGSLFKSAINRVTWLHFWRPQITAPTVTINAPKRRHTEVCSAPQHKTVASNYVTAEAASGSRTHLCDACTAAVRLASTCHRTKQTTASVLRTVVGSVVMVTAQSLLTQSSIRSKRADLEVAVHAG